MDLTQFKGFEADNEDIENETLLSELPLSIITGSIQKQFEDPTDYAKNDFVQSFITRYNLTKEYVEDDREKEELQSLYNQFITFMEGIFKERLNLGLPELDDSGEEEQLELIHYLYRFFIMNIKKNFTTLILTYIKENKNSLVEQLPKRKDVTTTSLKDVVTDSGDLSIITNIITVIDIILHQELSVEEFLSLSRGNGTNLENEFVNTAYDNFIVNGNFVLPYCALLSDTFRVEVECKVRNKILKKYRNK